MENSKTIRSKQNPWSVALIMSIGLALLFITVLLWGLRGATPVHADPGTRYVDITNGNDANIPCEDPDNPCASIGVALGHVQPGEEILIAGGRYVGTYNVAISSTLKGGYQPGNWDVRDIQAYSTVADADGADAPVLGVTPRLEVTFEGLTIEGANHSGEGGGLFINGATVLISATVIQSNTAGTMGGGIYVEQEDAAAAVSLIDSSLLNNKANGPGGGLMAQNEIPITLDSVTVQDNTAQGWGGGLKAQWVTITNSRIVSNAAVGRGGGVAAEAAYAYNSEISDNKVTGGDTGGGGIDVGASGAGRLVIKGSTVKGNLAVGTVGSLGGGINAGGAKLTMVNTIISNNSAEIRGGVEAYGAVLTVTNSLLISNTGGGLGGRYITGTIVNVTSADNTGIGLFVGGAVSVTNSIVWGNEEHDYFCTGGCSLTYSAVGNEEITGTGNIFADPRFVDPANDNYHLGVSSPCIDKGTPIGAPTHDIEDIPRDTVPDMGAYEWVGYRVFLPLTLRSFGP